MLTKGALRRRLPPETLSRLPAYRKQLSVLAAEGTEVVSSKELARRLSISDAQLRRDLSYMALLGRRGLGYEVETLLEITTRGLGLDKTWALAVIGGGSLGTALARYPGFAKSNMEVKALFDVDPGKIGKMIGQVPVYDLARFPEVASQLGLEIAILTVPEDQAQRAADVATMAGLKGLLNFTSVFVSVPPDVKVRSVDITSELQQLTHLMRFEALPL